MNCLVLAFLVTNALFWGLFPHSAHCQVVSEINKLIGTKGFASHADDGPIFFLNIPDPLSNFVWDRMRFKRSNFNFTKSAFRMLELSTVTPAFKARAYASSKSFNRVCDTPSPRARFVSIPMQISLTFFSLSSFRSRFCTIC